MSKIHKTHFTVPEMPWKKDECDHVYKRGNSTGAGWFCIKCGKWTRFSPHGADSNAKSSSSKA